MTFGRGLFSFRGRRMKIGRGEPQGKRAESLHRAGDGFVADVAEGEPEVGFEAGAEHFAGEADDAGFHGQPAGSLPAGALLQGMPHPGEEGAARHKAERIAGTGKERPEEVVPSGHHEPVLFHPAVQMADPVEHGMLGDARLADRHGVLGLKGVADELFRRGETAGPVPREGIGLAEGHQVDQVIPPAGVLEKIVGPLAAGDEVGIGFVQDQRDAPAPGQPVEFLDRFRRRDHAGGVGGGHQQDGPGARGDETLHRNGVRHPAPFLVKGKVDRPDAQDIQGHGMVEVGGERDDHLVPGAAEGHHGEPERLAGADGEAKLIRIHGRAVDPAVAGAHPFAHLGEPLVGRVFRHQRIVQERRQVVGQLTGRRIVGHGLAQIHQRALRVGLPVSEPALNLGDGSALD